MAIRWDMRNKTPQQQAIVAARDKNTSMIRNTSNGNIVSPVLVYTTAIFMKLGWDCTGNFDAFQTIEEYINCISEYGETWFSTNALASGISKKKKEEIITAINSKKLVYIYFVIGKSGGGTNEIEYRAQIEEIESVKGGIKSPDVSKTPEPWKDEISTIWIKITNLQKNRVKKIEDFEFVSNGKALSEVLNSNCCFGYIKEI